MTTALFIIVLILLASFGYAAVKGAPWVPTWRRDIDRMIALLDLQPGEQFYELGCGDGRVCTRVAKMTDAHATGIELSLLQWMAAKLRGMFHPNTRFVFGDIFKADLSRADAVYLFLMPEAYKKIAKKLAIELRPGTRVVSYVWPLPGWEPVKVDQKEGASDLFLYKKDHQSGGRGQEAAENRNG